MPKTATYFLMGFLALLFGGYYIHAYILQEKGTALSFSLWEVYLFHGIFSTGICLLLSLLASNEKLQPQLGFLYLGTVFLKLVAFSTLFSEQVLGKTSLPPQQATHLLAPLFLFLFLEVLYLPKLLNRLPSKKKLD